MSKEPKPLKLDIVETPPEISSVSLSEVAALARVKELELELAEVAAENEILRERDIEVNDECLKFENEIAKLKSKKSVGPVASLKDGTPLKVHGDLLDARSVAELVKSQHISEHMYCVLLVVDK